MASRPVAMRTRAAAPAGADSPSRVLLRDWDPARVAVVVCDMWDTHHCVTAARRVLEMAPRVNVVLGALRAQGSLIVHAPDACMAAYAGTPARRGATEAPHADVPYPVDWHTWEPDEWAALPPTLTQPGWCSCAPTGPPCGDVMASPWTRQTPRIEITDQDVVTDDGQEFYNVLAARGIDDVLVVGAATNVCVLSRPYGIRQLVYWGKRPVLCRDLTDSFHRDPRGHVSGTRQVVAHVERRWCPTVTSDQLVGGTPFRFEDGS